jgi:SAM-dependent methyltransferase
MTAVRDTTARVPAALVARLGATYGEACVRAQLEALARHGAAVEDPARWLEVALAGDFKPTGIETVGQCACGSRDFERLGWFVFWNLLGLRRCARCGTIVVSPRLDAPTVDRIFRESYFAAEGSDPNYWGARREPMFREVHGLLARLGARRVFDVGAAYGHQLAYLRAHGIEGAGCDLSPEVAAWGRANLGLALHAGPVTSVREPAGSFDAVICLDTLYYAHDPIADLRAMRRLVRPGGLLLLRLRNGLFARVRPDGRPGLVKPPMPHEHLWLFSPRSIDKVLRRGEFEVESLRAASYSETRWVRATGAWTALSRGLTAATAGAVPPLTHSFYVVARPLDVLLRTPPGEWRPR